MGVDFGVKKIREISKISEPPLTPSIVLKWCFGEGRIFSYCCALHKQRYCFWRTVKRFALIFVPVFNTQKPEAHPFAPWNGSGSAHS